MANRQLATVSLILGIVFANLDCTLGKYWTSNSVHDSKHPVFSIRVWKMILPFECIDFLAFSSQWPSAMWFTRSAGNLECEDLPIEYCAFSVASSGTRCVLEKYRGKDGIILYECQVQPSNNRGNCHFTRNFCNIKRSCSVYSKKCTISQSNR